MHLCICAVVAVLGSVVYLNPTADNGDTLTQMVDGVALQVWPVRTVRLWQHDAAAADESPDGKCAPHYSPSLVGVNVSQTLKSVVRIFFRAIDEAPRMFHPDYPVTNLRPAPYNPRQLEDDAFEALQRSILALGMVKPIIVADTGTIVAGHQRTRALLATGKTTTPAYVISNLNQQDEMKFNQLHNGTDLDTGDEHVTVPPSDVTGYVDVPCALVNGNPRAAGGPLRHTICGLLTLYGPWGGIVATKSGKCLSGAQYALSCKLVNLPVRVYYVEDTAAMQVRAIFQKQYGTFSYEHLPKTTYAQTFAQMYR